MRKIRASATTDSMPKVVILCGGRGLRLGNDPTLLPKPLAKIGGVPIILHIMKIYSHHGFNRFVLCLGYKGSVIKAFFKNPPPLPRSFDTRQFNVAFADTGQNTDTGGRVKLIESFIEEQHFFLTYADGLADIDPGDLYNFHVRRKKVLTMTCVKARSQFGFASLDGDGLVKDFRQKPRLSQWVNGGFFVCDRRIFKYLRLDDSLEERPFQELVKKKQLQAYKFDGFWACMDTYKDSKMLNDAWRQRQAKWKIW